MKKYLSVLIGAAFFFYAAASSAFQVWAIEWGINSAQYGERVLSPITIDSKQPQTVLHLDGCYIVNSKYNFNRLRFSLDPGDPSPLSVSIVDTHVVVAFNPPTFTLTDPNTPVDIKMDYSDYNKTYCTIFTVTITNNNVKK